MTVQDFRTGYYTLASPKALFTVQVCGAFLGVLYSPAVYTFYNHAFKSALGRWCSLSAANHAVITCLETMLCTCVQSGAERM